MYILYYYFLLFLASSLSFEMSSALSSCVQVCHQDIIGYIPLIVVLHIIQYDETRK